MRYYQKNPHFLNKHRKEKSIVTCIGDDAFYNCSSLSKVTIPAGLTRIGYAAFYKCNSLEMVDISDIESWCNVKFEDSYSNPLSYANNLYINGELVEILNIPDTITSISDYAFYDCDALTSVNVPECVTNIGEDVFRNCASLTNITIPGTVTSIGNRTFYYCPNLTSITIPNSITKICDYVFYKCSALEKVFFKGTEEEWNSVSICEKNEDLKNAEIIYVLDDETDKKDVCITSVSGEKIFTCIPSNLPENSTIILACYNGGKTVEIQQALNNNETIYFVTDKAFDKAKVMVWESINNLIPVCACELIE